MNIQEKSSILTGGASGLGLATVRCLAAEGARVVAVDLPGASDEGLADLGGAVQLVGADVTDESAVEAAVDMANATIIERF